MNIADNLTIGLDRQGLTSPEWKSLTLWNSYHFPDDQEMSFLGEKNIFVCHLKHHHFISAGEYRIAV